MISEDKPNGQSIEKAQSSLNQYSSNDGLYQNIIPLKVQNEPIYIEVETGYLAATNVRGSGAVDKTVRFPRCDSIKVNEITNTMTSRSKQIAEDQLHTIYAEIHHEVEVPKN